MTSPSSTPRAQPSNESPFGSGSGTPAQRIRRVSLWGALLLGAIALVVVATRKGHPEPPTTAHVQHSAPATNATTAVTLGERDQERIGVTFASVDQGPLERDLRIVGQVTVDETRITTASPRFDGWAERVHVDFTGKAVRKGEVLLELYSPMLVTAEQEYVLARQLQERIAAGTPDAVRGAEDVVAGARRRLVEWQLPETELRRLEDTRQPSRTVTLEAPVSGIVVEKNVLPGQRVMAGDGLYRIADLGTVWLDGEVFERDLPAVHLGQAITADFQALPGQQRAGRITYVYPTLNPETRTARVRISLPNPGLALKPGMYGTIRFTAVTSRQALSVPRSAVLATGQRNLVFVRRPDGRFTPRDVVLGLSTDERIEILGGLSAGETVVASGTFLVDAESNLATLMGGMGNMPGMDVTAPGMQDTAKTTAVPDTGMADMPGMTPTKPKE